MARRKRRDDYEGGDAARDGYTCISERPRTAAAGNFLSEEAADQFDEMTEMIADFAGDEARFRRRTNDPQDEGDPPNRPY